MTKQPFIVNRVSFDRACQALWTEMEYINTLPCQTEDEAKDVPGFLTRARRYMRQTEDAWADQPRTNIGGDVQVEDALHGIRKVAGIMIRAMVYNGIRSRMVK